jgi:hypothetical protein
MCIFQRTKILLKLALRSYRLKTLSKKSWISLKFRFNV